MSESAARSQRSVPGMLGAMLVLLLIIGVFVGVRSFTRENGEIRPTPVDYLAAVAEAQDLGFTVLYPREMPPGWIVTSVVVPRAAGKPWGLGMLTDEQRFVALRQESRSAQALIRAAMGAQAQVEGAVDVPGSALGGWRWVTSADESGLVSPRPGGVVLIYGTADSSDILRLAAALTESPLSAP